MEIAEIESHVVSIPLAEPAAFATRVVEARDHAIVFVRTDAGLEGVGYTLGYGGASLVADAVSDLLAPVLEGEDPRDTTRLWRELFDGTVQIGRRGVMLRAISIVDIALWDVAAKATGQPLYKHLGAAAEAVPAYASGGYYGEDKDLGDLHDEMAGYVDRGHDAVKLKVGRLTPAEDAARVRATREAIGPGTALYLDANGAWSTEREAVAACREFAPHDPAFIEEPVMPDRVELMAAVNDALPYGVAAGEQEATRYGFGHLLDAGAVDVIQPDATVVGGVTEWLTVAALAAASDVPVAPHYHWDIHAHLVAAVENGSQLEYFYPEEAPTTLHRLVEDPLAPDADGLVHLPDRPGHGVSVDKSRLDEWRA